MDMSLFYAQYEKVQPYLQNPTPAPAIERLQTPEERAQLDGFMSASYALVAPQVALLFGGTRTASLGPRAASSLSVSCRQP